MTIAMEDESSFTLSSSSASSTLSPQSNLSIQMLNQTGSCMRDQAAINIQSQPTLSSLNCNGGGAAQPVNGTADSPNGGGGGSIGDNCPFAIFLIRSNNGLDLFEERRISLDKPCKIGRSVAKIRPESNNAIFDCKVLSRNHALLWHENSKFYIQDTKSSNGTFLNGNRLGKSNEDSAPYELSSGDIVQFGVDVTENTKKVTHGCITVEIKLYHRQGVEATNKTNPQANKIDVQTQELYQLALFLQEAMVREEVLHQKINSLQTFIDEAKEISENGWLTLINEDRLLSRIDFLEKQTLLHTKAFNDEGITKMVTTLRDEKFNIENEAKATVQKMIEEKNQISEKYDELKSTFSIRDEECNQLQRINDVAKKNLVELAAKYQEVLVEVDELKNSLSETKAKFQEQLNEFETEKLGYEAKMTGMQETETNLKAQIESLMAEKDFQKKDFERIINKYEQNKSVSSSSNNNNNNNNNEVPLVGESDGQPVKNHTNENNDEQADEKSSAGDPYEDVFYSNESKSAADSNKNVLIEVTDAQLNKEKASSTKHKINSENDNLVNNNNNSVHDENDENSYTNGPISNHTGKSIDLNGLIESANLKELNHKTNKVNKVVNTSQTDSLGDLDKLAAELESLKAQLTAETTKNARLVDENKQLKSVSSHTESKAIDQAVDASSLSKLQEELRENDSKLKLMETELASKVKLIELLTMNNKMAVSAGSSMDNQEYVVLKNECQEMKNRLQVIEDNMKNYLNSSSVKLPSDDQFEQSYQQLQQLKENIQDKESKIQLNLTDAQKEADQNQQKLLIVQEQLQKLEETCENYKNRLLVAERTVKELNGEYDNLSLRTKIVSYFSTVPLFILILAVMVAFYPILATITATGL